MNERTSLHPLPGLRLGHYVLERLLDEGAVARVYEAIDQRDQTRVALKILRAHLADDATAIARWRLEYETAAAIDNRYVVRMLDRGVKESENLHYLVMEHLEGEKLSSCLARWGALPPATWLRLTAQLAVALRDAHRAGVIHRDIKPENILICPTNAGPELRLLDFGAVKLQITTGVKLTSVGMTLGTPHGMSPEQLQGRLDLDPRSDVFSSAAVVYEMACGQHPFRGASVHQTLQRIVEATPLLPSRLVATLPMQLDEALFRALHKDKRLRTGNIEAFAISVFAAFELSLSIDEVAAMHESDLAARLAAVGASSALFAGTVQPATAWPRRSPPWRWLVVGIGLVVILWAVWGRLQP